MLQLKTVNSGHNSPEKSVRTKVTHNPSNPYTIYSRFNARYTKRRHWIETNKKGMMRYCCQSYNDVKKQWANTTKKEKYYQFVAISIQFGVLKKIYIHPDLHISYIKDYLSKYLFDNVQMARIEQLIDERK